MSSALGDVLVGQGVIDQVDLQRALDAQAASGDPLGKTLVELGLANEQQIVQALARQLDMPYVDTGPDGGVDPEAAKLLPKVEARELVALPVSFGQYNDIVVAVADPGNTRALERVAQLTSMRTSAALTVRADLEQAIEHLADDAPAATAPAAPADGGGPQQQVSDDGAGADDEDAAAGAASGDDGLLAYEEASEIDLDAVLMELVQRKGSDLHLTAGVPPTIRLHGDLMPLEGYPVCKPRELQKTIYAVLNQRQREQFENELELDLSYSIPRVARFRVNVFQQRDSIGSVMRVIPHDILPLEDLGIPTQVANFAHMARGFVLVTGPTGSGKSTTLASLIDIVNTQRACHIMTVEDPIEFLHRHKKSVVNQRELGSDTRSFAQALKHVLRQDPDVILVGELRDLETIQVALTAAETGHLVFGTLHTQDTPQTIDRVIDVFPPHQQEQIRVMLAGALQGVVCQTLVKTPQGDGRVAACEVMVATPAIRNLVREGKTHQMYSSIQAGKQFGMVTMDQSLAELVQRGKITYDAALERCRDVNDFNRLVGRA